MSYIQSISSDCTTVSLQLDRKETPSTKVLLKHFNIVTMRDLTLKNCGMHCPRNNLSRKLLCVQEETGNTCSAESMFVVTVF